jgi:hypothetical protein
MKNLDLNTVDVEISTSESTGKALHTEIVFIESNVTDYQTLLNGITPGMEVHVLDASRDGLTQIAQILDASRY